MKRSKTLGAGGGRLALVWLASGVLLAAGGCRLFDDDEPQQQVLMAPQGYPMYYCQPTYVTQNACQPATINRTSPTGGLMPSPQPPPAAAGTGAAGSGTFLQGGTR